MTTTWYVKDIKTFEDFDKFLLDNGFTLEHDWSEMDWENTAVEHIDEMMADILMPYSTGEDEEWNIAGLSANDIGMQLVNYVFATYVQ